MVEQGYKFYLRVSDESISLHKTQLFYSFSKQQNSAVKVVTYRKMPVKNVTKLDIKEK